MAQVHLRHRAMYRPDDLMDIVAGVELYPDFIKYISAMRILKRSQISASHEQFEAEATISYKFISEKFRSLVDVKKDERKIIVTKPGQAGAVKALRNVWIFYPLSDGSTLIDFDIDVKLKAYPLELLLRDQFKKTGQKIMTYFEARAAQLYEKTGDPDLSLDAEYIRLDLKA